MIQRRGAIIRSIAHGIELLTIRKGRSHAEFRGLGRQRLKSCDGAGYGTQSIGRHPVAQGNQKKSFAVGGTAPVTIKSIRDQHISRFALRTKPADLSVVHKTPPINRKRMAIAATDCRSGRGPNMRQKQGGFHLFRQRPQVGVGPSWMNIAV